MNGLALYIASLEGVNIKTLASEFHISVDAVEERLVAAKLCFEQQVIAIDLIR